MGGKHAGGAFVRTGMSVRAADEEDFTIPSFWED